MSRMRIDNKEISDANIFETLLDSFPDIIHSVDDEGRIVFTNKKAETLLGYTREELLSMTVFELYPDDIREEVTKGFKNLKTAGDAWIPESALQTKSGEQIPVEIRSFSIYNDSGDFIRTFSILRDIRDRKELQNSLVHSGRLAAIGEMASGVAHDIKNPLTVILLAAQMISRELDRSTDGALSEELKRIPSFANDIERASMSIQKLVDHLRNFSRGIVEKYEVLDIYAVIADALFITANRLNRVAAVASSSVQKGQHFVTGSPNQLEQVFVNLISNASDAMEDCDPREVSIAVAPCTRGDEQFWQCSVTDTGPGIPDDTKEHIFESFFTTKEKGEGTGLGLSITRGIVKEHSGDIEVVSEVGKGTTFHVYLPVVQAEAMTDAGE